MRELEIVHAYVDGIPMSLIQENFGVTRAAVYYYLRKHNVKPNRKKILDDKVIQKMVDKYLEGVPLKQLNKEFGRRVDTTLYRNVEGNRRNDLSEEQKEVLKNNYGKMTNKKLAQMLGVSEATITFYTKGRDKNDIHG
ncbi:hypothetical protein [uncultured Clostridium sp.]|jgi:predicted transcriptional regulator|uniref:hypothetical protein n=2 Tax=uncultured Clostridium sp. TaxID=59620 RepID=UPI00261710CB|nr:hypothetical protein [uncultured Clostridium sp.]